MSWARVSDRLESLLQRPTSAVAITFVDSPPAGIERIASRAAAGCAYWRMAGVDGRVFYTAAEDHHGCAVGAHTHAAALPAEGQRELEGMIKTMVDLRYLAMEEVPTIPTLQHALRFTIYAPLSKTPVDPTVVMLKADGRRMMLLQEAAMLAKVVGASPTLGRPTCAIIPQAINSGHAASSFGCIGNRVYTDASDEEAYFAVPGASLSRLIEELDTVVKANQALETFHRARLASG